MSLILKSSYHRNRKQSVCTDNEFSTFKSVKLIIHQGSNLETLLFLAYSNDLPLSPNSVPKLFTDDTHRFMHR